MRSFGLSLIADASMVLDSEEYSPKECLRAALAEFEECEITTIAEAKRLIDFDDEGEHDDKSSV